MLTDCPPNYAEVCTLDQQLLFPDFRTGLDEFYDQLDQLAKDNAEVRNFEEREFGEDEVDQTYLRSLACA